MQVHGPHSGGKWVRKPRRSSYYSNPYLKLRLSSDLKNILAGYRSFLKEGLSIGDPEHVTYLLCGLSYVELHRYLDRYSEIFSDFILQIYDEIMSPAGEFRRFPQGFWQDYQGLVNLMIISRHLLRKNFERVYGKNFDQATIQEKVKMFSRGGQEQFLRHAVQHREKTWQKLLEELSLGPALKACRVPKEEYLKLLPPDLVESEIKRIGIRRDIPLSISLLFRLVFPDLFHYWNTPPDQHAHPWDIKSKSNSWGEVGMALAVNAVRHVLEQDLGLKMDERTRSIDPRLFEHHGQGFLDQHGFKDWDDLFYQTGLYTLPSSISEFEGSQVIMMRKTYPWAFALFDDHGNPVPPGKHLDYWKLFPRAARLWEKTSDIIEAVRHEWLNTGKSWHEFPRIFGKDWLRSDPVGLRGILEHFSILELVLLCFPDEVKQGKIKIEEFRYLSEWGEANKNPIKLIDSRGRVIIDQRRFFLPRKFSDGTWVVRRLEMNRVGIFKIVQEGNRRRFELTYTFNIEPDKTWIREEDLK